MATPAVKQETEGGMAQQIQAQIAKEAAIRVGQALPPKQLPFLSGEQAFEQLQQAGTIPKEAKYQSFDPVTGKVAYILPTPITIHVTSADGDYDVVLSGKELEDYNALGEWQKPYYRQYRGRQEQSHEDSIIFASSYTPPPESYSVVIKRAFETLLSPEQQQEVTSLTFAKDGHTRGWYEWYLSRADLSGWSHEERMARARFAAESGKTPYHLAIQPFGGTEQALEKAEVARQAEIAAGGIVHTTAYHLAQQDLAVAQRASGGKAYIDMSPTEQAEYNRIRQEEGWVPIGEAAARASQKMEVPAPLPNEPDRKIEVSVAEYGNYIKLSGEAQFNKAIELGIVPEGSKYVEGVEGSWSYYPPEVWEAVEQYGKEFVVSAEERSNALIELESYRVSGTDNYNIVQAIKDGKIDAVRKAGFDPMAIVDAQSEVAGIPIITMAYEKLRASGALTEEGLSLLDALKAEVDASTIRQAGYDLDENYYNQMRSAFLLEQKEYDAYMAASPEEKFNKLIEMDQIEAGSTFAGVDKEGNLTIYPPGQTPTPLTPGKVATITAEAVVPGLFVARHWNELTPLQQAGYIALDIVTLLPMIGWAAKVGVASAKTAATVSKTARVIQVAKSIEYATKTIPKGILWDFPKGMLTHPVRTTVGLAKITAEPIIHPLRTTSTLKGIIIGKVQLGNFISAGTLTTVGKAGTTVPMRTPWGAELNIYNPAIADPHRISGLRVNPIAETTVLSMVRSGRISRIPDPGFPQLDDASLANSKIASVKEVVRNYGFRSASELYGKDLVKAIYPDTPKMIVAEARLQKILTPEYAAMKRRVTDAVTRFTLEDLNAVRINNTEYNKMVAEGYPAERFFIQDTPAGKFYYMRGTVGTDAEFRNIARAGFIQAPEGQVIQAMPTRAEAIKEIAALPVRFTVVAGGAWMVEPEEFIPKEVLGTLKLKYPIYITDIGVVAEIWNIRMGTIRAYGEMMPSLPFGVEVEVPEGEKYGLAKLAGAGFLAEPYGVPKEEVLPERMAEIRTQMPYPMVGAIKAETPTVELLELLQNKGIFMELAPGAYTVKSTGQIVTLGGEDLEAQASYLQLAIETIVGKEGYGRALELFGLLPVLAVYPYAIEMAIAEEEATWELTPDARWEALGRLLYSKELQDAISKLSPERRGDVLRSLENIQKRFTEYGNPKILKPEAGVWTVSPATGEIPTVEITPEVSRVMGIGEVQPEEGIAPIKPISLEETSLLLEISKDNRLLMELQQSGGEPLYIMRITNRIQENMAKLAKLREVPDASIAFKEAIESKLGELGYTKEEIAEMGDSTRLEIVANNVSRKQIVTPEELIEEMPPEGRSIWRDLEVRYTELRKLEESPLSEENLALMEVIKQEIRELTEKLSELRKGREVKPPEPEMPPEKGGIAVKEKVEAKPKIKPITTEEIERLMKETEVVTEVKPEILPTLAPQKVITAVPFREGIPVPIPTPVPTLVLVPTPIPTPTPVPTPVLVPTPTPVPTPIPIPTPVPTPVPVLTPVPPPVLAPVPPPVLAPVSPPVLTPVPPPVLTPVPPPVLTPVPPPVLTPVPPLVPPPVPPPVSPPVPPPVPPPIILLPTEGEAGDRFKAGVPRGTVCFPAGTKIIVHKNIQRKCGWGGTYIQPNFPTTKKIEDIVIGDKVLSYNEKTSQKEAKIVTHIFMRQSSEFVIVKFSNGNQIKCTPEHPMAVVDGGSIRWVEAYQLSLDDIVIQYKYPSLNRRLECLDGDKQKAKVKATINARKGHTLEEIFGVAIAEKIRKGISVANSGKVSPTRGKTLEEAYGIEKAQLIKQHESIANRGNQKWLGCKHTEESKKKISLHHADMGGEKNGFYGRKHSEKSKQMGSKKIKERMANNYDYRFNKNRADGVRRYFKGHPEFGQKQGWRLCMDVRRSPNKSELALSHILRKIVPHEYKYNGDGRLGIMVGGMIPDFWNVNGKKKVIEFFGSYWHHDDESEKRIERYKKYGIDCLIIWDYEMGNKGAVKDRVLTFTHNPNVELVKVVSVEQYKTKTQPVYNLEVEDNNNYFAYGILVHNCWRQGMKWIAVPPPYDKKYWLDHPLPGTYKFASGRGSAAKTLQVIGGYPPNDVDLDMGWATIHISSKGKELTMKFTGGKEAAEERWAEERAAMDEYDRQSYDELPEEEVTEKIPRVVKPTPPLALGKVELPMYRAGRTKVFLVNGEYVRSELSQAFPEAVDFTQGSHYLVADFIPQNEIWIDKSLDTPEDRKATILHELREVREMKQGTKYAEAHEEVANPVELEARHNPDEMDEMLAEEIGEYRTRRKVYNSNGGQPIRRSRRVNRQREEVSNDPYLPPRYYQGRKLRDASLGIPL